MRFICPCANRSQGLPSHTVMQYVEEWPSQSQAMGCGPSLVSAGLIAGRLKATASCATMCNRWTSIVASCGCREVALRKAWDTHACQPPILKDWLMPQMTPKRHDHKLARASRCTWEDVQPGKWRLLTFQVGVDSPFWNLVYPWTTGISTTRLGQFERHFEGC